MKFHADTQSQLYPFMSNVVGAWLFKCQVKERMSAMLCPQGEKCKEDFTKPLSLNFYYLT